MASFLDLNCDAEVEVLYCQVGWVMVKWQVKAIDEAASWNLGNWDDEVDQSSNAMGHKWWNNTYNHK